MTADSEECARELLDTVPLVMGAIRKHMRRHRGPELSLPQFRTLVFLGRNEGAALSELAANLGLTPASTSTLVDGLVANRLARRRPSASDRRRVALSLTAAGRAKLNAARAATQTQLAARLSAVQAADLTRIVEAMRVLRAHFGDAVEPT